MIITEFMENGALDAFLRVRRVQDHLGRGTGHRAPPGHGPRLWEEETQPGP